MSSHRVRVLFLTCHLPYPPISGGRRREYELLRRIGDDFDVHVYATTKTYDEDREHVAALQEFCSQVQIFAKPDLRNAPTTYGGKRSLLVAENASPDLTRAAGQLVERGGVDLIHAEGFYMAQHARSRRVPLLLVEQNLEYMLCRQRAELSPVSNKRRAVVEYLRTLRDETNAWRSADVVGAVTSEEANMILEAAPDMDVRVLPDGFDHLVESGIAPGPMHITQPTVVFIANFAYQPNVDAALYLCHRVLPLIRARRPDVRVLLVGNAPPPAVSDLACDGVVVTGRVPDVSSYLSQAHLVISPLRIGGGIKVKVLEALH
ncbi:MAG: glycosyltransferase family 4 protein, partial [Actinomycetota bacterium]|nr:glycosyltransferase family 4 protein [Actinomycetota bacterium]